MIPFLLIISFLLHIISLVAIFQLIKQRQQNKPQDSSQEVMELLEVYLTEIREENNRLDTLLKKQSKPVISDEAAKKPLKKEVHEAPIEVEEPEEIEDTSEIDEILKEVPQDQLNASLESRVLQLHAQGKSIETIAKELDCGKTEAELIIKLYNRP
ncbi:DUF6115 domain-containing protein [Oceanobacillus sp. CAU 1775]